MRVHVGEPRSDERGRVVQTGLLVLDLARHTALVGDISVELTQKEFSLLLYLAERSGEAVSRERLLADVWGYHFDPCSNVVDVCVRRLRTKLGPGVLIETVRQLGYRLAA